jgi:penicillin-insensitive murein endopeptidase
MKFQGKKRWYFLGLLALAFLVLAFPELTHENKGKSKVSGTVANGQLTNAWLLPYRGKNFKYFSPLSYYVLDRAYVDSRVHAAVTAAYTELAEHYPNRYWRVMECSRKEGGRMWPHRTHRNGMSVDFMVPKQRNGKPTYWLDRLGVWHYGLQFDDAGKSTLLPSTSVDFEALGHHLLALDDAARKSGLYLKKVILKIELKDDFFASESGKSLKARGVYFARSLSDRVNNLHDDHYHVDFAVRKRAKSVG